MTRLAASAALVAVAFSLASIWSVEFFPSQDGPAHMGLVQAWDARGGEGGQLYRLYFADNVRLVPYWTANVVARGLLEVAEPPIADKLMVTILVVAFVGAAWYAMRAVDRRGSLLLVLAVPFATSWYLHKGFFNFVASVCLFLIVAGYWTRYGRRPALRHGVVLAILLATTYFSHLVSLVAAWVLMGSTALVWAARPPAVERRSYSAELWRITRVPLAASLPALVLLGWYAVGSADSRVAWELRPLLSWLRRAATLWFPLVSFDRLEWGAAIGLAVLIALGSAAALTAKALRGRWSWDDALLVTALVLTAAAYLSPVRAAQGSLITERIALYPALIILVWLGGQRLDDRLRAVLIAGGLAVSLLLTGMHLNAYRFADDEIREIASASSRVAEGSTLLPISLIDFTDPEYLRVRPLLHAGEWITLEREGINLGNPNASGNFSPLRFSPDVDPNVHILTTPAGFQTPPPRGNFLGYGQRTPGRVDYVLVVGLDREPGFEAEKQELLRQLDEEFELVYRSQPKGLALLFEHR